MQRITLSQGPIEYVDEGRGPVVLFVHGLLVDGRLWSGVVRQLAGTHRCIVPDWPLGSHRLPMAQGADLSPTGLAQLVADFMEALDLRDVTLVGNDTGGALCQLVAADHGERVAALVLTNCDAFEVFPPKAFAHLALLGRHPRLMTLVARLLLRFPTLRRLPNAYGGLAKRPIDASLLQGWVEPCAVDARIRDDVLAFLRGLDPAVTLGAAERLRHFERPALLLWAGEDRHFPLELADRLRGVLPKAELREIDDALTFSPLDRPDAIAREIAAFAPAAQRARARRA